MTSHFVSKPCFIFQLIPMSVLYGVFLFMGVSSMVGVQLIQRILIIFMPPKYQPDYMFLRTVPLRRVHMFTAVQVACLAVLWVIKTIKSISIVFPIMVRFLCILETSLLYINVPYTHFLFTGQKSVMCCIHSLKIVAGLCHVEGN